MNYLAIFALLLFPPFEAFKVLANIIVSQNFIFKSYSFDTTYLKKVNNIIEELIRSYLPNLYSLMKEIKFEMWTTIWLETIYPLFLKTFDLQTCFKIWDAIFVFGIPYVLQLIYAIFCTIDENLDQMDAENLYESTKILLVQKSQTILAKSFDQSKYQYEFYFIKKSIQKSQL